MSSAAAEPRSGVRIVAHSLPKDVSRGLV